MFLDVADDEHRTVERWGRVVGTGRLLRVARTGAEIIETADLVASFGFEQVGSIAVNVEDHVAGGVVDDCIRMGRAIVEKMRTRLGCGFSVLCLGCSKSAEGDQNG